jgi:hypothetical protein
MVTDEVVEAWLEFQKESMNSVPFLMLTLVNNIFFCKNTC